MKKLLKSVKHFLIAVVFLGLLGLLGNLSHTKAACTSVGGVLWNCGVERAVECWPAGCDDRIDDPCDCLYQCIGDPLFMGGCNQTSCSPNCGEIWNPGGCNISGFSCVYTEPAPTNTPAPGETPPPSCPGVCCWPGTCNGPHSEGDPYCDPDGASECCDSCSNPPSQGWVDIWFFEDDNGNGVWDNGEARIYDHDDPRIAGGTVTYSGGKDSGGSGNFTIDGFSPLQAKTGMVWLGDDQCTTVRNCPRLEWEYDDRFTEYNYNLGRTDEPPVPDSVYINRYHDSDSFSSDFDISTLRDTTWGGAANCGGACRRWGWNDTVPDPDVYYGPWRQQVQVNGGNGSFSRVTFTYTPPDPMYSPTVSSRTFPLYGETSGGGFDVQAISFGIMPILFPPNCEITNCPTTPLEVDELHTFTATSNDTDGTVVRTRMHWDTAVYPPSWTDFCTSDSDLCEEDLSFDTPGDYYVTCNAIDNESNYCTGNPWCEWELTGLNCSTIGPGFTDCGPNDYCEVEVVATCDITIPDATLDVGETIDDYRYSYLNPHGLDVDNIEYEVDDGLIAAVCEHGPIPPTPCEEVSGPDIEIADPFNELINMTGIAQGSTTITAYVYLDGYTDPVCQDTADINVIALPWWQVGFGDVVTNDDIVSYIPSGTSTCLLPNCIDKLISGISGAAGEGAAIFSGAVELGSGDVSESGLLVDMEPSTIDVSEYDYDYFTSRVPGFTGFPELTRDPDINPLEEDEITSIGQPVIDGGNTYEVIRISGSTAIYASDGTINLGTNKIILFVVGDLIINSPVRLLDGQGFFMAIVSGSIHINPVNVGGVHNNNPELEGIYVSTGGDINTGTTGASSDTTLEVRGVMAALTGRIYLDRDLLDDSATPAEKFYYGPDQTLMVPQFFGQYVYRWKEVAP